VTGGTRGIGLAAARALALAGAAVMVASRKEANCEAAEAELRGRPCQNGVQLTNGQTD
jgi:NAD(P)-dependent dehydrogenase (short-subunit alcohol dehydrogenase family)